MRGFTLIEILVAIAIIATITAFAVPAISSAIRNSRNERADANTKAFNQAASRARFKELVGAGTYGSDKQAAVDWYIAQNFTPDRDYKVDWNSYINGIWTSNLLGDPNGLASQAAAGNLSEAELAELLNRFGELSPDMLQAMSDGGYLAVSDAALSQATANGNASGLERYGNTLLTTSEMNLLMGDWLETNNTWEKNIYQGDDITTDWGRDWIKDVWTNPDYASDRQWYNWMWDVEDQVFRPNLDNYNSDEWNNIRSTLTGLPEGSDLYNEILDSLAIAETWNLEDETPFIVPVADLIPLQPTAKIGLQKYQELKPQLDTRFNEIQQMNLPTLQEIQSLPFTNQGSNWNSRQGTFTDANGETWTVYTSSYGIGASWEYTNISVNNNLNNADGTFSRYKSVALRPNGTLAWGGIQSTAQWQASPELGGFTQSSTIQRDLSGNLQQQINGAVSMQIDGNNQYGSYSGTAPLEVLINNPAELASSVYINSNNRAKTIQEQNRLANERLQYTDPEAYARNIQY